jgi:ankyrin repeat protein
LCGQERRKDSRNVLETRLPDIASCTRGHLEASALLIDRGADVNAAGHNRVTALSAAADANQIQLVRLLLERGADANATDEYGRSVLAQAVGRENVEMARLLLDKGADIEAPDVNGNTILSHEDIAALLKQASVAR